MHAARLSGQHWAVRAADAPTPHLFSCSSCMLPLMLPMAQHKVLSEPHEKSLPFICRAMCNSARLV